MKKFTALFICIILSLAFFTVYAGGAENTGGLSTESLEVSVKSIESSDITGLSSEISVESSEEDSLVGYAHDSSAAVSKAPEKVEEEPEKLTGFAKWWDEFSYDFYRCFIEDGRYNLLLEGIWVTIKVSLLSVGIGILIGFLIALCSLSKNKFLRAIGKVYTDIIRGTPSVTQLMIIYFVVFATVRWPKWVIASIAFGINSGAYVSEIIRAGILSIDKGQTEAGRSLGLSAPQTMLSIIVPQAVKNIFPALCNEFIVLIKETAIIGYIGIMDIQKAGDFIRSKTFEPFLPLLASAVIYFVLIKVLTIGLGFIEKALRKSDVR